MESIVVFSVNLIDIETFLILCYTIFVIMFYFETIEVKIMENMVRILGIVPYEGMRIMLNQIASTHEDLQLDCLVGDMEDGLQILRGIRAQDYDVIISRGGTAELLRQSSPLPIIEVALSVYDILRSLRLLDQYTRPYAVIGFPSITKSAYLLKDLLRAHFDVVTLHDQSDVEPQLLELKQNGYEMIVGDTITCATAQMLGLDNILINSGVESIEDALAQAVRYHQYSDSLMRKNRLLEQLAQSGVAVFDAQKHLLFSNLGSEEEKLLLSPMRHECDTLQSKGSCSFQRRSRSQETQYQVLGRLIPGDSEAPYCLFSALPQSTSGETILYLTPSILSQRSTGFSESRFHSLELQRQLEEFMPLPYPLIVYGEPGIGKESLVHLLYRHSTYAARPLACIDCEKLSAKSWSYLLTHLQSPLKGENSMILFSHCEKMPPTQRQQLISTMEDGSFFSLNKVVFTFTSQAQSPDDPFFRYLTEHTRAMKVYLPPLRESMEDIQNLITLSISALNRELGKQIIGVDHAAARLIRSYAWPENYAQFQRALTQMVIAAQGNMIDESTARKVLDREYATARNPAVYSPDTQMTLAQHTRQLILAVLAQENHNQTLAAKRLGISRSTLWRMLREAEGDGTQSP